MNLICPNCQSTSLKKNGHTHYGKQNHKCNDCGRQFVENGDAWFVSEETKSLIDKLLLERISLNGIIRVTGVSSSWLQQYIKRVYEAIPQDLGVVEEMPDLEAWLDDRMDEEIGRLNCIKKIRIYWKTIKK